MVVWFAHVRVGHRQLPIPKPPLNRVGVFFVKASYTYNYAMLTVPKSVLYILPLSSGLEMPLYLSLLDITQ